MARVVFRIIIATLLIITGLSLYNVFFPLAIQYVVENKIMILQSSSKFFQEWSDSKTPLKTEIYLFELINARDFLTGKKPHVREHGPFVFLHYRKKMNITFFEDDTKVSFQEMSTYYFDRTQSVAGLHDYNITVINLALMTTMNALWRQTQSGLLEVVSPAVSAFLKEILTSNSEYITERRTPGQILVGRRARFMDQIKRYLDIARNFGVDIAKSPVMEMKRVGFFQFTNNTLGGKVVINTGRRSFSDLVKEFILHKRENIWVRFYAFLFGYETFSELDDQELSKVEKVEFQFDRKVMKIDSMEGKRHYGKFYRKGCNDIKGTEGTLNNNYFVSENKELWLSLDSCIRPIKLLFDGKSKYDILNSANQYTLDPEAFVSRRDNWCFCPGVKAIRQPSATDKRTCSRNQSGGVSCRLVSPKNATVLYKISGDLEKCNGYHDMATCNEMLPIVITYPHFIGSPKLLRAVNGLDPDFVQHRSFLNIEPTFGVTMEGRVKIQVNVRTHPSASIRNYDRFKPTIMPYLWVSESGSMRPETVRTLSFGIACIYIGYFICIIIVITGVLVILMLMYVSRQKSKSNFFDLDKFKKNYSVKFEYNENEHGTVWNQKEILRSKLKNGKNLIDRKAQSNTSLNKILPTADTPSVEPPRPAAEGYYGSFESSQSKSHNGERLHSNGTVRSVRSIGTLPPLG